MRRQLNLKTIAGVLMIASALSPATALAEDTTTGIVAGLGLTAASGKTTLAGSAGAIEATILASDAFLSAGAEVRRLAADVAVAEKRDHPLVLVLGHSDTIDFAGARLVKARLDELVEALPKGACPASPSTPDKKPRLNDYDVKITGPGGKPAVPLVSDLTAALLTDTAISGVSVSADDRLLIDGVMIGQAAGQWRKLGDEAAPPPPDVTGVTFKLPGEINDYGPDRSMNKVAAAYGKLSQWLNDGNHRSCEAFKDVVASIQAYQQSITAADKGPSAFATAAELYPLAEQNPLILRLAIEGVGGTAIVRSNIWYSLGWPGASTISAGLLVSFRLSDPKSGANLLTGFIRCVTAEINLRKVRSVIDADHPPKPVVCRVLSSASPAPSPT